MDPNGGVFVTITKSTGVALVTLGALTRVTTGVYRGTIAVGATDPLGLYRLQSITQHGGRTFTGNPVGAFLVVA